MKVYRYMSVREFSLFCAGVEIVGKRYFRARTTSKGVCFLPESVTVEGSLGVNEPFVETLCPEQCIRFLSGIVSADVLVEFETSASLTASAGTYANPFTGDWDDLVEVGELCVPSYSREEFSATRYNVGGTWYPLWH